MPPRGPSSAAPRGGIIGSQKTVRNPQHSYTSPDAQPSLGGLLDYGNPPGYRSQDARDGGNFAVQPAAAPVKVSLKKSAVKVVRPAGLPAQDLLAAAVPINVNAPAVAKPITEDRCVETISSTLTIANNHE
jgi:hypothetical protein